ncbi:DEAD/DEAH box helicase [Phytoactinopolyspora halotolerans]|uniref:DEAD/DEAH box helicase n=1 Tax=Phytoactinopolyspora halotolerans TaxID=1981512 RepID=A0A6L9S9B6_9ACTN|nr:DEAD/DEAH box helicase [Phytoactinopolyspora halotolerans]NEE01152.1 DEAD/DEAH box helicase [Phytoactinopolyspora halotolerans]
MDAFRVHDRLIKDYAAFSEGFVEIHDERIRAKVVEETARGAQWPPPHLALNPAFQPGGSVDELVAHGILHEECGRVFRVKEDVADTGARPITLHQHQRDAVDVARTGASYVLTTGTGSGKSLAYIVPIVDAVLREGSGRGVRAIVVYPMNALANSQREELAKFLSHGYPAGPPVTFARYTGQESDEERRRILADPPDILLTNYVMLELVLTRPEERKHLIRAASGLRFLVLDELHTYRGRQGADVAMLVRRVREACHAHDTLQCIGTSATMASGDTIADQRQEVARVATQIFGTEVAPRNVITETLVRATSVRDPDPADLKAAVRARGDVEADDPSLRAPFESFRADPLAAWIEAEFGLIPEPGTGILVRRSPRTIVESAETLARVTGEPLESCATAIRATLLAGSRIRDGETNRPLFAFRLHQFLSKGGTIFATAEREDVREITTQYQVVLSGEPERRLFPLAFCRECGQDYLLVRQEETDEGDTVFRARHALRPSDGADGYLFVSADREWPANPIAEGRLPGSWLTQTSSGLEVVRYRRSYVPRRCWVDVDGTSSPTDPGDGSTLAAWIPGTFRFCLRCGVSYEAPRTNEFAKLVTLDREGRSSAMSVISASILSTLRSISDDDLPSEARKLLTFVDNRQDASLQAGHFNDFALIVQLRAAIYRAAQEAQRVGSDGLHALELGEAVTRALSLDPAEYALAPDAIVGRHRVLRALRNVVEYRAMRDMQASWRITLPNLERTGLLIVDYPDVAELAQIDEVWQDTHPRLRSAAPGLRAELAHVLLDEMRRVLAIDSHALTDEFVQRLRRESRDNLTGLWSVPDNEPDPPLGLAVVGAGSGSYRNKLHMSGRSAYGRWLRQAERFGDELSTEEATDIIDALVSLLAAQGVVTQVNADGDVGYRLNSSTMVLRPGTGDHGVPDPVRRRFEPDQSPRVVPFFRDLYRQAGTDLAGLRAAEHTAQVRAEDREDRERRFGEARTLPLLFCSPTMELGVDIRSLNAVAMRNVPPTPANYAQRSGRAGRSGQPAVVVTYCASGNSHDSYYFQRPQLMVSGRVQPPRLDLANEDLMRSHVHAVWLAETGQELGRSLADVLDLGEPAYPVRAELAEGLQDQGARKRAASTVRALLAPLQEQLERAPWWTASWIDDVIEGAYSAFDTACQRWRDLYSVVEAERREADAMAGNAAARKADRLDATQRWREAIQRMNLLLNETNETGQSDFYTYRYLASEGFLPGYSFPRLPLSAYIPGMQGRENTWLQRPRFLAISEFGPGALIYHEGARYQVTRVNLPRQSQGTGGSDVVLTEARVCEACGYHHLRGAGTDVCEQCAAPLRVTLKGMLHLQTVVTRRRQRISADEEERNRVGFDLLTTYRFVPRGGRTGRLTAEAISSDGTPLAELAYGDSAEIRVINLGRKRRQHQELHGFPLDLVQGRWLTEKDVEEDGTDDDEQFETTADSVPRKARVVPYVQDRRNILVVRWTGSVTDEQARTLQYALERGIEATFQLEDSELLSEQLPDSDGRGRILYVEAAEGGAGVLRRLQAEPDALAAAAREALRIIHVDPDNGEDFEDACVRGCYRCLLSYGNQLYHEQIDRREVIDTLRSLVGGSTNPHADSPGESSKPWEDLPLSDIEGRLREVLEIVRESGARRPDRIDSEVDGVQVDLVYETAAVPSVVVIDTEHETRDISALAFGGWNVIRIGWFDDPAEVISENRSVFYEGVA